MARKRKLSKGTITKAHKQAKRLMGHKNISNPYALATWQTKKGFKVGGRKKKH